jgi:glycosyltransferase involved in cell wall biosynthesis
MDAALNKTKGKKVAIVHDWLVGGGAERVVQSLHEIFPEAPIYTSYSTKEWRQKLDNKVVTGFLQYWPFSKLRKFLPVFRIWWFEHLDLTNYDIVISSSGNGEAKGVKKLKSGALHICYCHSPTHFYWDKYDEYLKSPGFGIFNPLAKLGLKALVGPLRKWDLKASARPDYFIANSTHIQKMIKKYYNRDSAVIHPPVDTERFLTPKSKIQAIRSGFVTAGRQTPYKKTHLIVEACKKLDTPLAVLGDGPDHKILKKIAGPKTNFICPASDKDIERALLKARSFIFASNEDFGILPIEAMSSGTPVIAYKAGGALDYINSKTGLFFTEQTVESLANAIKKFNKLSFNQKELIRQSKRFDKSSFKDKLIKYMEDVCTF